MDNFFIIIPFLVPLWLMYIAYKQYKNKKNAVEEYEKKLAWFEKNKWLRYIKTIYIDRGVVKFWSAIWYVPLLFCSVFGIISTLGYFQDSIFSPIPLDKMQIQTGKIVSIKLRKKMKDILILKINQNKQVVYAINSSQSEVKQLLHKNVKVWYTKGWSSGFTMENIVYDITINEKSIRKYPYDYEHYLEVNKSSFNFALTCIYITLLSLFAIWIQNRKEKPYHRLYRLNRYKKLKTRKEK